MAGHNQKIYLFALAASVGIVFLLPVNIPYTVKAPGKVLAAREWIVTRQTDGRLMSTLVDHKRGVHQNYAVSQFERGDAVQFSLREPVIAGGRVATGDTIGTIRSNEFEYALVALEGELQEAKASLKLSSSGQKESVVAEAERNVRFAQKALEEQRRIATRLDSLYRRNLISREKYELAADQTELREIEVAIAEARLKSATSGARSEQIALIQSRIRALKNEISTLSKRQNQFVLISPLSGFVNQVFSTDTMLVISDTTEFIIMMPVEWTERKHLVIGDPVKLSVSGAEHVPEGQLVNVGRSVGTLNGKAILLATAAVAGTDVDLAPGLMVACAIECDRVRPSEFCWRFAKSLFN